MKPLMALSLLLGVLTFIGCGKDDPVPDLREAAVGEYVGTAKYYVLDGSSLVDLNDDDNIEFEVAKGTSQGTITVTIDGDSFTGTKVTEATNGFAFDINSFEVDDINFSGYQGIDLGGTKYHGRFEKNNERLTFFIQYTDTDSGFTFVIRVQGDL